MPLLIAGVDEAGRGALAGPVVSAAVIFTDKTPLGLFKDSKVLSEAKRNEYYAIILDTCIVSIAQRDEHVIDKINILNATLESMKEAIEQLKKKPSKIIIDGNKQPMMPNHLIETLVKGDQKIPEISAASIVAKVSRDRLMTTFHKSYPHYGFNINKGYGTAKHYEGLFKVGPCPIHRKSFNLNKQETLF
jgi:ribonuclease HII